MHNARLNCPHANVRGNCDNVHLSLDNKEYLLNLAHKVQDLK